MSIFDDDQTPSEKQRPTEQPKQANKSVDSDTFDITAPSDSYQSPVNTNSKSDSLWGSMFELENPAPVSKERIEPDLGDFEPLDENSNRNLSHALTGIQDEGPAEKPQPKPAPIRQEVRNPFMSSATEPHAYPHKESQQPELPPEEPEPPTEPTPMAATPTPSAARSSIGYGQLLTWAGLALVLILSVWNMVQLSETDLQINALTNSVDRLNQKVRLLGGDELDNLPPDLTPELKTLNDRVDRLSSQIGTLQRLPEGEATLPSDLKGQLDTLNSRLDAIENNLSVAEAKTSTPAPTPKSTTTAKPVPKIAATDNWYINIAVLSDRKNAFALRDKARSQGTDTQVESYPSNGKTLYRVRAYGYASQSSAEQDAQRLQNALNLNGLWVTKSK